MRLLLIITIILVAGSIVGGFVASKDETEQIKGAERKFIDGFVQPDIAKLDQVLASDFTVTHSNGVILNKTQYLYEFRRGESKYSSV